MAVYRNRGTAILRTSGIVYSNAWWPREDLDCRLGLTSDEGFSPAIWLDRSGLVNDFTQAVAGDQPAFSAGRFGIRDGIDFVGATKAMGNVSLAPSFGNNTNEPYTIAAIFKLLGAAPNDIFGVSQGANTQRVTVIPGSDVCQRLDAAAANNSVGLPANDLNTHALAVTWDGTTIKRNQDNSLATGGSVAQAAILFDLVQLGAFRASFGANFSYGEVWEIHRAWSNQENARFVWYRAVRGYA